MLRKSFRSGVRNLPSDSPKSIRKDDNHISEKSHSPVDFKISAAIEILQSPGRSLQLSSSITLTRENAEFSGSIYKRICKNITAILESEEVFFKYFKVV